VKFKAFFSVCAVAAAAFLWCGAAAKAVTYNFNNVLLSDGGFLDGNLTIDFGGVFGYHLVTTGGNPALDTTYNYPGFPSPNSIPFGAPMVVQLFPGSFTAMLQLAFTTDLMLGGPTVLIGGNPGPSFECNGDFQCPAGVPGTQGPARWVAANTDISPTPLPAALPLFIGGAGLLGFLVRRRKAVSAATA
jgi:hypothetical protein